MKQNLETSARKELVLAITTYTFFICILPTLFCIASSVYILAYSSANPDTTYQDWLNENKLRVDFSVYKTRDEVRRALLKKFPVGTPEDELKAFYQANILQVSRPYGWEPESIESACWNTQRIYGFSCKYGEIIWVEEAYGRHTLRRMFSGDYIIYFELDPDTRRLVDIQVGYYNGNLP